MVGDVWKRITEPNRAFIIAEAGVNHNGRLETAKRMIDAALTFGADAVKFQTFRVERLASPDSPKADYQPERDQGSDHESHRPGITVVGCPADILHNRDKLSDI